MKRIVIIGSMIVLFMFFSKLAGAQPDFSNAITRHGVKLFKDVKEPNTYYYLPGDLEIGLSPDGRPDFSFIMMRYTGSAVYNEDESIRHRNILSIRLLMKRINDDSLRLARTTVGNRSTPAVLKPMPISMIEAMVLFTPVTENDSSTIVGKGGLSAEHSSGYGTTGSYWEERSFTIHLDNHSANLLLEAFKRDYTALSFAYAFYARGKNSGHELEVNAPAHIASSFRNPANDNEADSTNGIVERIVKSAAFAIYVDTLKYADIIRKIDVNDGVPPGYAILNVRNYDFANRLREDLYEKSVDLEATGAGGNKVVASVSFRSSAPDITSTNFKFKYAVRLDLPYRYRIRELLNDGREIISEWKHSNMWPALLDITTQKH